jgi:hypothetical protein
MNIKRIAAVAGLTLSMAAFSPMVFAQTGGGVGAPSSGISSSAPAASGSASGGSASTTAHHMAKHASRTVKTETNARRAQTTVQRRIAAARGQGLDVSKAEAEEKAGNAELQHGNRQLALNHFHRAEHDLNMVEHRSGTSAKQPAPSR